MSLLSAFLLGLIQGVAEFLPISSSGHLAIAQNLFHLTPEGVDDVFFSILLHLGTLVAVFVAYWGDIREMVVEFFLGIRDIARRQTPTPVPPARRLILMLVVGTLPLFAVLPLQDWLAMDGKIRLEDPSAERINVPAVPRYYWRYRMHLTLENLLGQREFNNSIKEMTASSGR